MSRITSRLRLYVLVIAAILALVPNFAATRAQDSTASQVALSGVPTLITLRMPGGVSPYTPVIDHPPQHGTTAIAGPTAVTYTAAPDYTGPDALTYTLTDASGRSHRATVQITVIAPGAAPGAAPDDDSRTDAGTDSSTDSATAAAIPRDRQQVPGEYILYYRDSATPADIRAQVAAQGGTIVHEIPQLNAVVIRTDSRTDATTLSAVPGVAAVEPNLIRYPLRPRQSTIPDDPRTGSQWSLNNMYVYDAWDISQGTGQVIAVLDTGVDLDHPDLQAHLLSGYDFVDDDSNASPESSDEDHGSHVTGIANAATNNGVGMAGVAWDARTLPVRIIGPSGASSVDIANGIIWATDNGADVINMSLGGPGWIRIERDAVLYAAARGVVILAAAGNDSTAVDYYPASYEHVISVASTTSTNSRSSFSNTSPFVDLAAPGSSIYSTVYNDSYGYMSGTSMATPNAAGVVALVRAAGNATTMHEVTEALLCTALDLGSAGRDDSYGYGLVQADLAVSYVPGTNPCLPAPPHDNFDTPRSINSSLYTDITDITDATGWEDDPDPASGGGDCNTMSSIFHSVWYRYDPFRAGTLSLDTGGSNFDTVLAVFTGDRDNLVARGCSDDASGTASALDVIVQEGQPVYVMVAAKDYFSSGANLTLHATYEGFIEPGCYPAGDGTIICTTE